MRNIPLKLFAILVLLMALGPGAYGRDGILLTYAADRFVVMWASDVAFRPLLALGDQVHYGVSNDAVVILSNRGKRGEWTLDVLERASGTVTASFAIAASVPRSALRSAQSVMIDDDAVYFVTLRSAAVRGLTVGRFELSRVRLSNGSLQGFPLPAECGRPQVSSLGGVPLVFASDGSGIWKFDVIKGSLERVVSKADLAPSLEFEQRFEARSKVTEDHYGMYVAVPASGVYRISPLGYAQKVLEPNLKRAMLLPPGKRITKAGGLSVIASGAYQGEPAVGVVRQRRSGTRYFAYVNPENQTVQWGTPLPTGAVIESLAPSGEGFIDYVDTSSRSVNRLSFTGVKTLWKLNASEDDLRALRILSVREAHE